MYMINIALLHLTIGVYALSTLLFYIDYLHPNKKAKKVAFSLLLFAWISQCLQIFLKMDSEHWFPVLSVKEGLQFYVWIIMSISLILNKNKRSDLLVFFINTVGFFIYSLYTFTPNQSMDVSSSNALISELLIIHIVLAFLSYGGFSTSFVFSIMYLMEYNLLKRKRWGARLHRFADLSFLEKHTFTINVIATSLYMVALILGTVWAVITKQSAFMLDPKFLVSFFVLLLYITNLFLSKKQYIQGKKKVYFNIGCFIAVLINFFLVGPFSSFHFI